MVENLVSVLHSGFEAKTTAKSLPTGPHQSTAPITNAITSVVNRQGIQN